MATTFRPCEPDRMLLLAPDVREWLPEGHFAHHVSDLVDGLDLTAFYAPYEGDGRRNAPYEPRMMVKVLLYGYATGVFSSRAMARRLEEDVAFRVLGAGHFPSHRTLCEFRRRHLEDFKGLFVGVVRVAREMGLARIGKVSIDGTKVRANASKRKAMNYGRMGENDQGAMVGLLDEVEETFDAQPETVLADAGYCNERDLSELEARGIDGYVAPGREGKRVADKDAKRHPATHRMVEKLATPTGRERYAQRRWLSEAPNGWIKACPRMVLSGGSARINTNETPVRSSVHAACSLVDSPPAVAKGDPEPGPVVRRFFERSGGVLMSPHNGRIDEQLLEVFSAAMLYPLPKGASRCCAFPIGESAGRRRSSPRTHRAGRAMGYRCVPGRGRLR